MTAYRPLRVKANIACVESVVRREFQGVIAIHRRPLLPHRTASRSVHTRSPQSDQSRISPPKNPTLNLQLERSFKPLWPPAIGFMKTDRPASRRRFELLPH